MKQTSDTQLAEWVERAREGNRSALEALLDAIRDDLYNLAVRMLWHPDDAEDATQEILVRIVTGLDTFRGESRFRTWAWRVASNHLLTTRRRRAERPELTFDDFREDLEKGLATGPVRSGENDAERALLAEEVKIGCSQGMLLCLDRGHRLAYILGEILGLDHREGADVLDITPAAFRKRLSRARQRLHAFVRRCCGLVNESAPCRCERRVDRAIELGRVDPDQPLFATRARPESEAVQYWKTVETIRDEASLFRSNPAYAEPGRFNEALKELLENRAS